MFMEKRSINTKKKFSKERKFLKMRGNAFNTAAKRVRKMNRRCCFGECGIISLNKFDKPINNGELRL